MLGRLEIFSGVIVFSTNVIFSLFLCLFFAFSTRSALLSIPIVKYPFSDIFRVKNPSAHPISKQDPPSGAICGFINFYLSKLSVRFFLVYDSCVDNFNHIPSEIRVLETWLTMNDSVADISASTPSLRKI